MIYNSGKLIKYNIHLSNTVLSLSRSLKHKTAENHSLKKIEHNKTFIGRKKTRFEVWQQINTKRKMSEYLSLQK